MNLKKLGILVSVILIFAACGQNKSGSKSANSSESGYSDGTYCAEVDYYNPYTSTRKTYNFEVEVEDGDLVQINFPNGGYLDGSHFSPVDISDGNASFESDKGAEYEVRIIREGNCGSSSYDYPDEDEAETRKKRRNEEEEEERRRRRIEEEEDEERRRKERRREEEEEERRRNEEDN
jgi:hypothetical protein